MATEPTALRGRFHIVDAALKAELSASFLKCTTSARLSQTYIAALRHQKSEEVCSTPSSLQVADVAFYERLYTPQRIYLSSAKELLRTIPLALRIITAQGDQLTRPLTLVDIQEVAKRCPSNSTQVLMGFPIKF
ncbi:hypothetical protein BCV72DRAFT_310596 [Rhizopus microsporus var. microsporus]|uniref:Uncharacterized protein n=1 Tax=Rhizopus microsporus var. microsporus TaxID=86635 RepID=A0A1X0QM62_RHIZD|nr:hypothetical protein BCV72DRAFT_310596 [Rhizopus microsporus var. microsporus]